MAGAVDFFCDGKHDNSSLYYSSGTNLFQVLASHHKRIMASFQPTKQEKQTESNECTLPKSMEPALPTWLWKEAPIYPVVAADKRLCLKSFAQEKTFQCKFACKNKEAERSQGMRMTLFGKWQSYGHGAKLELQYVHTHDAFCCPTKAPVKPYLYCICRASSLMTPVQKEQYSKTKSRT